MTQHVKQIVGVGFWAVVALGAPSGWAQDFTAGKTPAQLFRSDCSECHRTPNGLAKNRDVATLAGFLREHYTTKAESAVALAAYVSGFSGRGPADVRNRAASATAAEPATGERRPAVPRSRREVETAAGAEDSRPGPRGADDQPVRRRATIATQSVGDAANPRPPDPRNPRRSPNGGAAVAAAPAAPPPRKRQVRLQVPLPMQVVSLSRPQQRPRRHLRRICRRGCAPTSIPDWPSTRRSRKPIRRCRPIPASAMIPRTAPKCLRACLHLVMPAPVRQTFQARFPNLSSPHRRYHRPIRCVSGRKPVEGLRARGTRECSRGMAPVPAARMPVRDRNPV